MFALILSVLYVFLFARFAWPFLAKLHQPFKGLAWFLGGPVVVYHLLMATITLSVTTEMAVLGKDPVGILGGYLIVFGSYYWWPDAMKVPFRSRIKVVKIVAWVALIIAVPALVLLIDFFMAMGS